MFIVALGDIGLSGGVAPAEDLVDFVKRVVTIAIWRYQTRLELDLSTIRQRNGFARPENAILKNCVYRSHISVLRSNIISEDTRKCD